MEIGNNKILSKGASSLEDKCIEIYIETDLFTYNNIGSVIATETWIRDWFSGVKELYANESIEIRISDIHVKTQPSWSDNLVDIVEILNKFGEVTQNNYSGRLAHFITQRNLGGGVAWLGTYDWDYATSNGQHFGPYAVSGNMTLSFSEFPNYSWNVNVFAHEMGHNLGSSHTFECVWNGGDRIDDCFINNQCNLIQPIEYSTIMSYCHLTAHGIDFNLGFGTLPGGLIRSNVALSQRLYCECEAVVIDAPVSGDIKGYTFELKPGAELLPNTNLILCDTI